MHRFRVIIQPSFPNNRRSTRFPRKRAVARRVWKEEESSAYYGVPATALFTPFDIPNPLEDAPVLVNYHAIHYSDAGGYAPAQPCPDLSASPFGGFGQPQFNASEYLSSQFNPFVKENIPPVITSVIWDTKESWGWSWGYPHCEHAWVEIDAYILDVAPYTVVIGVTDRDTYLTFTGTGGQYAQVHHAVIDLDYWGDVIAEYYINVTVWDQASNTAYYEKEVAGILGSFTNFLGDVWNAVCGVFAAAWECVMAAVNWIVEWVKGIIEGLINTVITPIKNGLSNYIARLMTQITLAFAEFDEKGAISQDTVNAIEDALLGWLLQFMQPFSDIMNYIYSFISPFLEAMKSLAEAIINFVVKLINPSANSVELPYLAFSDLESLARNGFEFFGIECNTPTWLSIVLFIAKFALGVVTFIYMGIEDSSGLLALGSSLMLGGFVALIGWMVNDLAELTTDQTGKEEYKTLSGLLTLLGFGSFILALYGTIKAPKGPIQILGVIALILSGIGLWVSLTPIGGG